MTTCSPKGSDQCNVWPVFLPTMVTARLSEPVNLRKFRRLSPLVQLYRNVLRLFAPLM